MNEADSELVHTILQQAGLKQEADLSKVFKFNLLSFFTIQADITIYYSGWRIAD